MKLRKEICIPCVDEDALILSRDNTSHGVFPTFGLRGFAPPAEMMYFNSILWGAWTSRSQTMLHASLDFQKFEVGC